MGGIGKTEICRRLAHDCSTKANSVIWLEAKNGLLPELQGVVAPELGIDPQEPDYLEPESASEMSVNNKRVLDALLTLPWHLVATSRDNLPQFDERRNIDVLPLEDCESLFKHHYISNINDIEQAYLTQLITLAGHHTLTIELLAKIAEDNGLTVTEIFNQVKQTGFDLTSLTDDGVYAENSGRQDQLHEHLGELFKLFKLSDDEQTLLALLAILPYQFYDFQEQVKIWLDLDKVKPLLTLSKKGWLQRDEEKHQSFALHPVIAHVAQQKVGLTDNTINEFATRFNNSIQISEVEHWIEKLPYISHLPVLMGSVRMVKC
jgi:hypothetical protein